MDFENVVIPYLQKNSEPFDSTDKEMFRKKWNRFSKLSGIRRLKEEGYNDSILEIFDFSVSL